MIPGSSSNSHTLSLCRFCDFGTSLVYFVFVSTWFTLHPHTPRRQSRSVTSVLNAICTRAQLHFGLLFFNFPTPPCIVDEIPSTQTPSHLLLLVSIESSSSGGPSTVPQRIRRCDDTLVVRKCIASIFEATCVHVTLPTSLAFCCRIHLTVCLFVYVTTSRVIRFSQLSVHLDCPQCECVPLWPPLCVCTWYHWYCTPVLWRRKDERARTHAHNSDSVFLC